MANHILKRELIRYINGSKRRIREIEEHLLKCSACAKRYAGLMKIFEPSNQLIEPSEKLEQRILATYRSQTLNTRPLYKNNIFTMRRLAAAAVILVAFAGIIFTVKSMTQRDVLPLYVYYYKGHALIDDVQVAYHMPIKDKSKIKVENGAVLVLAYKNRFIVKIYEKSELILKQKGEVTEKGDRQILFNLAKGTLFTRFNQTQHETKYFYLTPNASLSASRSEFIMSVAQNRTVVIPKGGNINIKSIQDEKQIKASPENHYIITSSIEIRESSEYKGSDELNKIIDTPFNEEEMTNLKDLLESMS